MHADDALDLTIQNCRPNRLAGPCVAIGLGFLWATAFGIRVSGLLDGLFHPEIDLCGLAMVTCVVLSLAYVLQPVRAWKLGQTLVVSSKQKYRPADIRELAFAADPAEDYNDAASPVRLCEIRARLRRWSDVRLIASVGDARRVRSWAVRHGITVSDPAGVLVSLNSND